MVYKAGEFIFPTSQRKPLSLRQHSCKIGVFLDWDAGNVSFYNMIDGSHIYPFTGITFYGTLHPYFSLQGAGASLTICAASDHTENCPDSSPKTSLTHLSSCDISVPQETLYYLHKKWSVSTSAASAQASYRYVVQESSSSWRVGHSH